MPAASEYLSDLSSYLNASPSSFHAAHSAGLRLLEAGFARLEESEQWPVAAGKYFVIRGGALIAWVKQANAGPLTGFHIVGAHTDSPTFTLKPRPSSGRAGWLQAGVEVYGGPLLNSWLDRELILAGRIVTRDGVEHLVRTGPLLRFAQLAIHLDRAANDGLVLDRQQHMNPVWGLGDPGHADLLTVVLEEAGLKPADVGGFDVVIADSQQPQRFGAGGAFLAAGRLDNLVSVHAGLHALIGGSSADGAQRPIAVVAAFDHEEVGSASRSGASGPFLEDVLLRISAGTGAGLEERMRAMASSVCISADAAHAVHPNYPERHDPANRPVPNGGPVLKINANQRYATDAPGASLWAGLCQRTSVPYQEFVSNNAIPCGSTIGPLTATRLGIRTLDVGIPILSMHSAREMCGVEDPYRLARVLGEFFHGGPGDSPSSGTMH